KRLHRRFDRLGEQLWFNEPVIPPVPKFRNTAERRTRIISVFNLKGGVGKTTLTASLAAVISQRPTKPRILLVDADWQGTLTALCTADTTQHDALVRGGRLLHRVIGGAKPPEN